MALLCVHVCLSLKFCDQSSILLFLFPILNCIKNVPNFWCAHSLMLLYRNKQGFVVLFLDSVSKLASSYHT